MNTEEKFQEGHFEEGNDGRGGGDPTPETADARPETGPEEQYLELQKELDEKFNKELAPLMRDPAKYNEFWSKLFRFPIVGVSEGGGPARIEAENISVPPLDASRRMASAAYAYDEYTYIDPKSANAPGIPDSLRNKLPKFDHFGLGGGKISFGVGEEKGKRFLIFRKLQRPNYRGGYPYVCAIDPGEALRKKFDANDATLIRNILADPVWRHFLLERPDVGNEVIGNILLARLEQSYPKAEPAYPSEMKSMIEGSTSGPGVVAEPTPEQMAQLMAGMPEEERKEYTFLINGNVTMGNAGGMKHVWDPVFGPGGSAYK